MSVQQSFLVTGSPTPTAIPSRGDNVLENHHDPRGTSISSPAAIGTLSACGAIFLLTGIIVTFTVRRARRNPGRYGPRQADPENPDGLVEGQSRAKGLTRALVETFPTTTWGSIRVRRAQERNGQQMRITEMAEKEQQGDLEAEGVDSPAGEGRSTEPGADRAPPQGETAKEAEADSQGQVEPTQPQADVQELSLAESVQIDPSAVVEAAVIDLDEVVPLPIGVEVPVLAAVPGASRLPFDRKDTTESQKEHCSICTEAFESGDEVRVLPCVGSHHFHIHCIDAWLLINGICPLCREDLKRHEDLTLDSSNSEQSLVAPRRQRLMQSLDLIRPRASPEASPRRRTLDLG